MLKLATEFALIDRAAAIDQRSRMEFMRAAALNEAQEGLLSRKLLQLNAQAFDHFVAAMEGPAVISPEMLSVVPHEAPWAED